MITPSFDHVAEIFSDEERIHHVDWVILCRDVHVRNTQHMFTVFSCHVFWLTVWYTVYHLCVFHLMPSLLHYIYVSSWKGSDALFCKQQAVHLKSSVLFLLKLKCFNQGVFFPPVQSYGTCSHDIPVLMNWHQGWQRITGWGFRE